MMIPSNLSHLNLDRQCAEIGYKCACGVVNSLGGEAKTAKNLITKGLAVLQEQGLYAFILFCRSRNTRGAWVKLEESACGFLRGGGYVGDGDLLEEIRKENGLAFDLEALLLAQHAVQQILVYAKYHVKAQEPHESRQPEEVSDELAGVAMDL